MKKAVTEVGVPIMTISPFLLVVLIVFGGVFAIKSGRASAERKRRLWAALKAGEPWAIAIVILVATYVAYVILSYESPQ